MSEIMISLTGHNKNVHAFFVNVLLFPSFLEICSTLLTLLCTKCLFHMNEHKDMVRNVIFVGKKVQDEMVHEKNIYKPNTLFFFGFKSEISRFQTYFTISKSS